MNQGYTRTLLYSLASKMGRRKEDMEKFIKVLESQWFDSRETLATLKPSDYQRLQIPGGLASMIAEAVAEKKSQRMDIESPIEEYLMALSQRLPQNIFAERIQTLTKIFVNIRENLIDEKFRVLKKSNAKIAKLFQNREIVNVLRYGGFQQQNPGLVMNKVNIGTIDECIQSVGKFMPKIKFNPYEEHISSIGSTNISEYGGQSSVAYNQKLSDLEKQRELMMSKPIKDRQIRIFQFEPSQRMQIEQQFNQEKEYNNEDERIYMENMKKILMKQTQDPKFINRRKQEYLDLVKKPCFTETYIRVKLHDNWIFQCKFSPLQTLETLVKIFRESLQNPQLDCYLYMTPPVEKLAGVILRKTFYDLGCVPRAIFYFKCESNLVGNIFRPLKQKGLYGF